jgi:hypothetical protein
MTEDGLVIPISDHMKRLRGPDLTEQKVNSLSELGNGEPDQEPPPQPSPQHSPLFSRAFHEAEDIISQIEQLRTKIEQATFKSQRSRYTKKVRRLNEAFERLTTRNYEFNRLVSKYAEEHKGSVENIADLIRWLRKNGELSSIQDHAARTRLKKAFGI